MYSRDSGNKYAYIDVEILHNIHYNSQIHNIHHNLLYNDLVQNLQTIHSLLHKYRHKLISIDIFAFSILSAFTTPKSESFFLCCNIFRTNFVAYDKRECFFTSSAHAATPKRSLPSEFNDS